MTSESAKKRQKDSGLVATLSQPKTILLLVGIAITLALIYFNSRPAQKTSENSSKIQESKETPTEEEENEEDLDSKKNSAEDSRLTELSSDIEKFSDAKDFKGLCAEMKGRDLNFLLEGKFKDSHWINYNTAIKKCVLTFAEGKFWPFPAEKLECCVGENILKALKVEFLNYDGGKTKEFYAAVKQRTKKQKEDVCYLILSGQPRDPQDILSLAQVDLPQCLLYSLKILD